MGPPFSFRAGREGFRKLANFHEYLGPILFTADFAHMNYLQIESRRSRALSEIDDRSDALAL